MSPRAERGTHRRTALLVAAATAAAILGAELGLQTWARYVRTPYENYDRQARVSTLVPGRYPTSSGAIEINPSGFVGAPILKSDESSWRIVALGDSCTFGAGDRSGTYPAMLEARLREEPEAAQSMRRYEVVNAGLSGLDSEHALRRLESAVPELRPEVVTVYLGWNDLMKYSPRSQTRDARLSEASRLVDRLWLVRALRRVVFFHGRPVLWAPATGPDSRSGRFVRFTPTYFEGNLKAIVRSARGMGSDVVLLTLPTAVREDMGVDELQMRRIQFPYFSSANAVGDFLDLVDSYNRAIGRVAIEEQVPVADAARIFRELPSTTEYFYDSMHLSPKGMEVVAHVLAEVLARHNLLGPTRRQLRPAAADSGGRASSPIRAR